jgi:hypothetical protein
MQRVVIIVYIMMEMNNMFNVTKALKKLIECSIGDGTKHCNGYVTFAELNAIFESGQSDEPETMFATACCELMKRVASIEERLERLEEHKHDNADGAINMKYPSKPIEPMATYSEHGVEIGKPEKTVTDALSIGHLSDIGAFKQKGAKLKPVTEENTCYCYESGTCSYCRNKKYDKPSEFISLPRWVAERYIRYVEAKDTPEAIEYYRSRQDVIDAIKQQLG